MPPPLSSTTLKRVRILFLAMMIVALWPVFSYASNNRMAGTQPGEDGSGVHFKSPGDTRLLHKFYKNGDWPIRIREVDMQDLESIGLSPPTAYEADIWLGLDRNFVTMAYKRLSNSPDNENLYEASLKILATGGRSDLLSRSSSISPGQDFLTLRLKKLNALGAFSMASELYRSMIDLPYHPDLALAGVTAFLGSEEYEEACLEVWSYDKFIHNKLWEDLRQFCENRFRGMSEDDLDYPVNLSFKDAVKTPLARIIVYQKSGKTRIKHDNIESYQRPARFGLAMADYIARMSDHPHTPYALDAMFMKYRVGTVNLESFKSLLQTAGEKHLDKNKTDSDPAQGDPGIRENIPDIIHLAILYQKYIVTLDDRKRARTLKKAIDIARSQGPYALHPFLDLIHEPVLNKLSYSDKTSVFVAFSTHPKYKNKVNTGWLSAYLLESYSDAIKKNSLRQTDHAFVAVMSFLLNTSMAIESLPHTEREEFIKNSLPESFVSLFQLAHNLLNHRVALQNKEADLPPLFKVLGKYLVKMHDDYLSKKAPKNRTYEKHLVLTRHSNYVIKSFDLGQTLRNAALKRSESQMFLSALTFIGNKSLQSLEQDMLKTVITTINKVGPAGTAKTITLHALPGPDFNKEK